MYTPAFRWSCVGGWRWDRASPVLQSTLRRLVREVPHADPPLRVRGLCLGWNDLYHRYTNVQGFEKLI